MSYEKPNINSTTSEEIVKTWFSSGAGQDSSDSISNTISHFFQTIRENRWLIILFLLLGCIAGVIKALSEVPVYQAKLTMTVEPSSMRSNTPSVFDPYAYRFYQTQYELLKSRSVAERVVDKLKLIDRESIKELLVPPGILRTLGTEINNITGIEVVKQIKVPSSLPKTEQQRISRKQWLTSIIQGGVEVAGGDKTNLVHVTFRSTNSDFAAEVANALVGAYIEQGLDSQINRTQQTSQWLSQRIVELKRTLDEAQKNLQDFLVREGMLGSTRSSQITTSQLQSLNSEYVESRSKLDDLAKRYGPRHPRIAAARAEVSAAKTRLDLKAKEIASTRTKEIELNRLERDVEVNQELYEAFLAKFKEADLSTSGAQVASARVVDKALPPKRPTHPQKQKIILIWTMMGLFLGVGLSLIRDQLDTTFKSARLIEDKLGLPLLGVVQSMPSDIQSVERHYLDNKRSIFSESVNHIRTGVMYSNVDHPPQVVMITSSVQSEGKTTIASNLALAYAQLGSTLLIDADLRRPRIKQIIETDHPYGLVDFVAGAIPFKDCVIQDDVEKQLYILNSGTPPPNPLELLSSIRFQEILKKLREKFQYIIIDTAPVLPASDAIVLGSLSDCLLLAVQSDRTTHHMARDAIKRLSASRVHVDGLILTKANLKRSNSYGYAGYYGYGAYTYAQDFETEKKSKTN